MSNYEQSNVGMGMVPCRKGCRCLECQLEAKDKEIERLTAERDHAIEHRNMARDEAVRLKKEHGQMNVELIAERAEIGWLREALEFYADPSTYHGCLFMFDRPTGGFDEDFSDDHGNDFYDRKMPGKLARAALADEPEQSNE